MVEAIQGERNPSGLLSSREFCHGENGAGRAAAAGTSSKPINWVVTASAWGVCADDAVPAEVMCSLIQKTQVVGLIIRRKRDGWLPALAAFRLKASRVKWLGSLRTQM